MGLYVNITTPLQSVKQNSPQIRKYNRASMRHHEWRQKHDDRYGHVRPDPHPQIPYFNVLMNRFKFPTRIVTIQPINVCHVKSTPPHATTATIVKSPATKPATASA
jgi:hypothetical protein